MRLSRFARTFAPLSAVALTAGGLAVAPVANSMTDLNYVAMGDSYSAGSGIAPLTASPWNPECTQSALNYAHDLSASNAGLHLTDVTCGGAKTADFTGNQFGVVAPQVNALSANTDLVTMTIGGNDNDVFVDALLACGSAGTATLGFGHPCTTMYGSSFVDKVNNSTYPNLLAAFSTVKAKAPNARIAVAGYPQILPQTGPGCFPTMAIAEGDVPYVNNLEVTLNSAIQRAAAATGLQYVDIFGPSSGHDACQPIGTRWVEPALWGTNFVPVHPNALGERAYAAAFGSALHS